MPCLTPMSVSTNLAAGAGLLCVAARQLRATWRQAGPGEVGAGRGLRIAFCRGWGCGGESPLWSRGVTPSTGEGRTNAPSRNSEFGIFAKSKIRNFDLPFAERNFDSPFTERNFDFSDLHWIPGIDHHGRTI